MKTRTICIVALAAFIGVLLPMTPASAAGKITMINPSGYSTTKVISNKMDADNTYHFVAAVSSIPTQPIVEFQVLNLAQIGGGEVATLTATRVGTSDTWEADFGIPAGTVDGTQYQVSAIIYSNNGTTEDSSEQTLITIQNTPPAQANTAEIAYPMAGGPVGFFHPRDKATNSVVTGFASEGTQQVRVLYSTTAIGSPAEWSECGSAVPGSTAPHAWRARCNLKDTDNFTTVKAIAAVANSTPPPGPPQAAGDESGDAHRVFPYAQVPTKIDFDESQIQADPTKCEPFTIEVDDQSNVPIAGLNLDLHGKGPSDQLRFSEMTDDTTQLAINSPFQAPDQGHSKEAAGKCKPTNAANQQGEHNVAGGADIKHIESVAGTNNQGQFTAVLLSPDAGGTQVTAWADENDNDAPDLTEASGSAQIGWGQAPPPPEKTLFVDPSQANATVGDCQKFVAVARQNGSPLSGQNVDIHISNPNGVAFCNPGGSTTRPPDSGNHTGDKDNDGDNTFHNEGETDSSGQVIFGVTSTSTGDTDIFVWLDDTDNDVQDSAETITTAKVTWQEEGARSISLKSNKKKAHSGSMVTFSGTISGSDACSDNQAVKLQWRKPSGHRFHRLTRTKTNTQGDYTVRVEVNQTRDYRAVAPKNGPCEKAPSHIVTVRAT
jgi:hypothetical protein